MNSTKIRRRCFLRGVVGSTAVGLALPPLEAMLNTHGTAYADGSAIPCRLGLWFWGNGHSNRWNVRTAASGGWEPTATDRSHDLAPLIEAGVASDVSVVTGFEAHHDNVGPHHVGRAVILTGTYTYPTGGGRYRYGGPHGPSMTYYAAEQWDGRTSYRSIDMGVSPSESNGVYRPSNGEVCNNTGNAESVEYNPRALYGRLFAMIDPGSPPPVDLTAVRRSALDAVLADARALQQRLGYADRQRLDAHLAGIRSLEQRMQGQGPVCSRPDEPGDDDFYQTGPSSDRMKEKHEVMADLLAVALACDLSRVFSMTFSKMQHNAPFTEIGQSTGLHDITHRTISDWDAQLHAGTRLAMEQFSYLVQRLSEVNIGASRLIDHCCVLGTSEMSYDHVYRSMPILVAGTAGGRLRRGAHVHSDRRELTTKILLTLIQAVGINATSFGDGEKRATETVAGLWA